MTPTTLLCITPCVGIRVGVREIVGNPYFPDEEEIVQNLLQATCAWNFTFSRECERGTAWGRQK